MYKSFLGESNVSDWKKLKMEEVTLLLRRGTAPTYVDSSDVRAIGQRCVRDSGFDAEAARPHDASLLNGVIWAQPGDVLLNSTGTGTIGRSCLFRGAERFIIDGHVTVLRADERVVESGWIDILLRSPWGQAHLESQCFVGSTNQVELSRSEIAQMEIPVPPLGEQRRIVEMMVAFSFQERALERELSKMRSVKQGIVGQLLGSIDSRSV